MTSPPPAPPAEPPAQSRRRERRQLSHIINNAYSYTPYNDWYTAYTGGSTCPSATCTFDLGSSSCTSASWTANKYALIGNKGQSCTDACEGNPSGSPIGRCVNAIAKLYEDKVKADASRDSPAPWAQYVFMWHMHTFGLKTLARKNLTTLLASCMAWADKNERIKTFTDLCGLAEKPFNERRVTMVTKVRMWP